MLSQARDERNRKIDCESDRICDVAYTSPDLWLYEAERTAFLQKVRHAPRALIEYSHRSRIFQGPIFRAALWTMIGLAFVWTVAFFFSELLQCIPLSVNWSGFGSLHGQCLDVNMMMIAQAWSDVAINIVILALPIVKVCLQSQSWYKFLTQPRSSSYNYPWGGS